MDGHQSTRPIGGVPAVPTRRCMQRSQPWPWAALVSVATAVVLVGCAPAPLTPVDTGAHLQAPTALTPLQQLRRMAPAPGLQLPDPLRAARQALRDEMVDEQGIASWYGSGLHGRRTASGERFDSMDMTAAHKTLPFGTRVCVRSSVTGKSVVVRVNDRGNFPRGRIIDLSRAAFSAIGNPRSGLIKVRIEVL